MGEGAGRLIIEELNMLERAARGSTLRCSVQLE